MGDRGAAVASTLSDIGDQDYRLANADSLSHKAKVNLLVISGLNNLRHELGTFYYILTRLFSYACSYVHEMKGVVEWEASNRDAFERYVLTSHQATALLDNVSRLLSEYLNAYVQASCTGNLNHPGSLPLISFEHLCEEVRLFPYHGPARLQPTLRNLIRERDVRRAADGLPTPDGSGPHEFSWRWRQRLQEPAKAASVEVAVEATHAVAALSKTSMRMPVVAPAMYAKVPRPQTHHESLS